jgi:hypothetical protein
MMKKIPSYGLLSGILGMATTLSVAMLEGGAAQANPSMMLADIEAISQTSSMSQVRGVSELSDVSPTDWAYSALSDLIERYNCIAGYPNGTFRGDRSLSRYEFAAGLNACLQQIERLIAETTGNFVTRDDLETVERLMAEFEAELAMLSTKVDNLESRVEFLEDNQFSTTTKLRGNVFMHLNQAWSSGDILAEGTDAFTASRDATGATTRRTITDDPELTFQYLTWLNFNTSFTGKDTLAMQLAVGNGNGPANTYVSAGLFNTWGVTFTDQNSGNANEVRIRELFYQFPVNDKLHLVVGPRVNWYRYFDGNRYSNIFKGADSFNSGGGSLINTLDRGAGAVALFNLSDQLKFNVGYLGESTEFLNGPNFNTAASAGEGLFSGTYTISGELTYSPMDDLNLRFLYTRSRLNSTFGFLGAGGQGEPLYGLADDGTGGDVHDGNADTYSFNFDWQPLEWLGLFGRYTYGKVHVTPVNTAINDRHIIGQAVQAGLAFPDLGKEGSLLTFSYLIPFSVLDGREFIISGAGDGGIQYEFEANYFYPVTNNIALVPSFFWINNPNNFGANPDVYVANLRAQFSF